jgi:hypothetical protein
MTRPAACGRRARSDAPDLGNGWGAHGVTRPTWETPKLIEELNARGHESGAGFCFRRCLSGALRQVKSRAKTGASRGMMRLEFASEPLPFPGRRASGGPGGSHVRPVQVVTRSTGTRF